MSEISTSESVSVPLPVIAGAVSVRAADELSPVSSEMTGASSVPVIVTTTF